MRRLYLVPIIHMSPDMGSLASVLDENAAAKLGQELWRKHKEIISNFWDSITRFFTSLHVGGFKIYQDGLLANGAEGFRIVREGINHGSKNYQVVGELLARGAILVKTEDLALVKQEHSYIMRITKAKLPREKEDALRKYELVQSELLRRRDDFIAQQITETLKEGESGVLFIGAYHDVSSKLPDDVQIVPVKDIAKVREYYRTLTTSQKCSQRLRELVQYLVSPV